MAFSFHYSLGTAGDKKRDVWKCTWRVSGVCRCSCFKELIVLDLSLLVCVCVCVCVKNVPYQSNKTHTTIIHSPYINRTLGFQEFNLLNQQPNSMNQEEIQLSPASLSNALFYLSVSIILLPFTRTPWNHSQMNPTIIWPLAFSQART